MQSFRRYDGRTSWVFCIEVDGHNIVTRQGRAGGKMRERAIACRDPAAAERRRATLIRQRLEEGYEPEGGSANRRCARPSPELEAALGRDPSDEASRLVYADWLLNQADPLGDLVLTELEWERTGDPRLLSRLGRLRRRCAGNLADRLDLKLSWWSGTVHKITVRDVTSVRQQLPSILAMPPLRTVGIVELATRTPEEPLQTFIEALARLRPASVHEIQLLHTGLPAATPRTHARLRPLADLPHLDGVTLRLPPGHLVALPMERVRRFRLDLSSAELVDRLRARTWPALERLALDGAAAPANVGRLLLSALPRLHAPQLRTLVLRRLALPHRGLEALLRSPLGRSLATLDLSTSRVDRGGLRRLAARDVHVRRVVRWKR